MSLDNFVTLYLDYVNNFLTVAGFAEHHGLSLETATKIVEAGRIVASIEV